MRWSFGKDWLEDYQLDLSMSGSTFTEVPTDAVICGLFGGKRQWFCQFGCAGREERFEF